MSKIKISAELVKELRDKTGASIMECRNALIEAEGDLEKAAEFLRKRGKEKAAKKALRTTAEGVITSYIHSNKKIGAMVELFCETDFVAKNSEFQELAHDLAMHITATSPKYVSFDDVSENEKSEYEKFVREELASQSASPADKKKPAEIIEKIVSGKVKKHFEEISLMNQPFVKNPEITIDDFIKEKISKIGENIQVGKFVRFEISS
ncbi:MAG TPA: translation elongation factor Ts [Candidatus Bathyarchaeia archaeon]|nr:translation elongation factor Ts [Candidatus Bathyarchaeia archaeon]